MIYIVTRTFNTASWIYYGRREEGGRVLSPEGKRVEVPTACAVFPRELLAWPPRSYAERIYNITQWTEMPRGGHFAAMEQPDLLIEDIRKFARCLGWWLNSKKDCWGNSFVEGFLCSLKQEQVQ